jgi:hypothetical protein
MGSTFASLLETLIAVRDAEWDDDPQRNEARLDAVESTLQTMLEMLRDRFDP